MSTIDFQKIADSVLNQYQLDTQLVKLSTAKRHAIKINNLFGYQNTYTMTNSMKSRELITSPVKAIAIFCNEYVPDHFANNDYFKYVLTVNGVDHEVVPINSERNGKKVVRTSESNSSADYVDYISEPVKSAFLTITIMAPNTTETPYISNLKILMGGDVNV